MGFIQQLIKGFLIFFVTATIYISVKIDRKYKTKVKCGMSVDSNSSDPTKLQKSINYTAYVFTAESSAVKDYQPPNYNLTIISRDFFGYLSEKLFNTAYPGTDIYTQYIVAQSQLKSPIRMEVFQFDFGAVFSDVNAYFYQARIKKCQNAAGRSGLFVAIISAPKNSKNRVAIRQTWLQHLQLESNIRSLKIIGLGFIVGLSESLEIQKKIQEESIMHNDILQINIIDHYNNLTLKVVGLLKWMNDHCSGVDYMLKVDDDVYVNAKNLITIIANLNSSEFSVYGSAGESTPVRDVGKNYVSFEDWPWLWYPPFARGGAVLIPGVTIEPLLAASKTTPYFPFEDVYLSGLCTNKARIKVRFSNRFFVGTTTIYTQSPEPCHVHSYATWLTHSIEHLKQSHVATEDFYRGAEKCIVKRSNDTLTTIDPTKTVNFLFTNWDTLSETINWAEVIFD